MRPAVLTRVDDAYSDQLTQILADHAVALRLIAGSEEAGYLAQIFPLPQTPTVVIIKNGDLKEYITSGTSREEFIRRVQSSFNISPQPASSQPVSSTPAPQVPQPDAIPPQAQRSENVQRVLAERAARLQAQKDEDERKAKDERIKAKEKAKADAEAGLDSEAARNHQQAELLKKRRQQVYDERRRILKRIEDDREERRIRSAEKERSRIDSQMTGDVAAALVNAPETKMPSTTRVGEMTAIQVRLFDGSTLRSRFKTASTVKDLRTWVDENRGDGKVPYRFKQVLTPLPNKDIDETEESKDLGTLGLAPSSTLVLIPVQKFASAYEGSSGGLFSTILAMVLGFFTWILRLVGLGGESSQAAAAEPQQAASEQGRRAREMQDDRRQREQQFYNGNSVSL